MIKIPEEIVADFEINVKGVVDGLFSGRFRSRILGGSPEFAEHRPYVEGDDIRKIDWKAYARKGKLYTKLFTNETEVPLLVIYDNSKSMSLWNKGRFAGLVAGSLLYVSNKMNSRFAVINLSGNFVPFDKGISHVLRCYYEITRSKGGETNIFETILAVVSTIKKRIMSVVISDMETDHAILQKSLGLLSKHSDTVVIHVLSGEEWNFKHDGKVLIDIESNRRVIVSPDSANMYRKKIKAWCSGIKKLVLQMGGRYCLTFSDAPFDREILKVIETMEVV